MLESKAIIHLKVNRVDAFGVVDRGLRLMDVCNLKSSATAILQLISKSTVWPLKLPFNAGKFVLRTAKLSKALLLGYSQKGCVGCYLSANVLSILTLRSCYD